MSNPEDYHVGWICALHTEYVAARAMLDDRHDELDYISIHDDNHYTLGRIGKHNVVIAVMPDGEYGTATAAGVAKDMLHSFPNVRIGLMVGIGGGAPSKKNDIRLGDIVVSAPRDGLGGVFQYDFGKTIQGKTFQTTRFLNQPPASIRGALNGLRAQHDEDGHRIEVTIDEAFKNKPNLRERYQRRGASNDMLYQSSFVHPDPEELCAEICATSSSMLVQRLERTDISKIHYGLIASANQLMKNAEVRDRLAAEKNVLCFEMEAAGLMNHFPCLVVRGICDYSDTHKNKEWQGYAAMTAAAYAKDLLLQIPQKRVEAEKKISEVVSEVNRNVLEVKTVVGHLQTDHHLDKVKQWLSSPDPSINLNKALGQRHEGSGQWLLVSKAYSAWKAERNSFMWLNGIPGCGKTILSSTVIKDLESTKSSQSTLYFYFDFTDTAKQSLDGALRSLINQLSHKNPDTWECLNRLYSSCKNGWEQPNTQSLAKTFQDMIQQAGETWIVLDALDECPNREESSDGGFLSWIKRLQDPELNVHTLVTSRPEQDITSAFTRWIQNAKIISLQSNEVNDDIRAYIKEKVGQLNRWDDRADIRDKIENRLMKADGMFRWVSCQFDILKQCYSPSEVDSALETLPRTLDDTYARILSGIPRNHQPYARRLLQFLSFSERPLRIEEAVDAIAVNLEEAPGFNPAKRMPVPAEITQYCSSLTILANVPNRQGGTVTEVQLAHFSVKEYLTSDRLDKDLARDMKETAARTAIAKVCLTYLLSIKSDSLDQVLQKFPLAHYSARYWMSHAVAKKESRQALVTTMMQLFTSKNTYHLYYQLLYPAIRWQYPEERLVPEPLYHASQGGLVECVQILLNKGAYVNALNGDFGNALQEASYNGHKKIVEILLDKEANVNAQSGYHGNALQAASYNGHKEIVETLLNKGANINAQGGHFGNALQATSCSGHKEIVETLLDKGADVNVQGGYLGNALQAASFGGYKEIIETLLNKGADVNVQGGYFGNALQAASFGGYKEIVETLLNKGADVNAQSGYYGNALQAASYNEQRKIVETLLNKGANINAQGGRHGNAFQGARFKIKKGSY